MIFESIKSAPAKVIHVFNLEDCDTQSTFWKTSESNVYKVGRSVDTDMRIADISVSRVHSFLKVVDGQVVLTDNGSKFGTMVRITKPSLLAQAQIDNYPMTNEAMRQSIFQIGRSLVYFKLEQ